MEQENPRVTIDISPDLKRAIALRVAMSARTQKDIIKEVLLTAFQPELKLLEAMEPETKEVKHDE